MTTGTRVGLLHPGEMGASIGRALRIAGVEVRWVSEDRSPETRARAEAAKLADAATLRALVTLTDVVVSICPPYAALDVARGVAAKRFTGTYVDANAVAPATARRIAEVVEAAGARFVDADIIGGPVRGRTGPRLYLSGVEAPAVASLFTGTPVQPVVLDGDATAASALKMCYAAWTKGSSAMLLAIRSLARAQGVEDALLAEWAMSQRQLTARSEDAAAATVPKAWRFVGEMEEIAATFGAAGLPDGFARAAAEVYRRLARLGGASEPSLDDVTAALTAGRGPGRATGP